MPNSCNRARSLCRRHHQLNGFCVFLFSRMCRMTLHISAGSSATKHTDEAISFCSHLEPSHHINDIVALRRKEQIRLESKSFCSTQLASILPQTLHRPLLLLPLQSPPLTLRVLRRFCTEDLLRQARHTLDT
jgi:hypothetical protein